MNEDGCSYSKQAQPKHIYGMEREGLRRSLENHETRVQGGYITIMLVWDSYQNSIYDNPNGTCEEPYWGTFREYGPAYSYFWEGSARSYTGTWDYWMSPETQYTAERYWGSFSALGGVVAMWIRSTPLGSPFWQLLVFTSIPRMRASCMSVAVWKSTWVSRSSPHSF